MGIHACIQAALGSVWKLSAGIHNEHLPYAHATPGMKRESAKRMTDFIRSVRGA